MSLMTGAKITGRLHHRQTHLSRRKIESCSSFANGGLFWGFMRQRTASAGSSKTSLAHPFLLRAFAHLALAAFCADFRRWSQHVHRGFEHALPAGLNAF